MRPTISLKDVFGAVVYCPRPSSSACRWIPPGNPFLNSLTGGQLVLAGETAVLCSRGVSTPAALQLLADGGFSPPLNLHRFKTAEEHLEHMRILAQSDRPIVLNHFHPPDELDPDCCWISPDLLNYLNNKANLPELVPMENIPPRRVYTAEELKKDLLRVKLPVVLKAAVDETSGGGADVRVCLNAYQLKRALGRFSNTGQIIVESFLDMAANYCLNYAIMPDGNAMFLGGAEQVIDKRRIYRGNWIEAQPSLPPAALDLGAKIAARGAALGYYGLLGIDIAVLPDELVVAYDLNYRANGSTVALVFSDSIFCRTGASVMRLRSWTGQAGYKPLLKAAYRALHSGFFLPLWSYDPSADGYMNSPARIGGLILGNTRQEIQAFESEIAAMGLK